MRRGLAVKDHFDRRRHFKPILARYHRKSKIGAAHTGRKCPQRAVGTGVAIRADDDVTGYYEPLFRHQRVLYTHIFFVEIVFQIVLISKLA